MSEPASISSGIAKRYATAVFDLSKESGSLDRLEADIEALQAGLSASADLRKMIASPIYSREQQASAIGAIATKMGLSDTMGNTLRLMAQKRRLFVVPALLHSLSAMIAAAKGEVTAQVVSAKALSEAQVDRLARALKARVGSDVKINASVDESLIGGLVVKVGSMMIDTSIAAKLNALQNTMKEVG